MEAGKDETTVYILEGQVDRPHGLLYISLTLAAAVLRLLLVRDIPRREKGRVHARARAA
jgi:hypothetical protein